MLCDCKTLSFVLRMQKMDAPVSLRVKQLQVATHLRPSISPVNLWDIVRSALLRNCSKGVGTLRCTSYTVFTLWLLDAQHTIAETAYATACPQSLVACTSSICTPESVILLRSLSQPRALVSTTQRCSKSILIGHCLVHPAEK